MSELSQLNLAVQEYIASRSDLLDNVFQADPVVARMRKNIQKGFPGGSKIWELFVYDGLNGGAFPLGGTFNITGKQTQQRLEFAPKQFYTNVTLDKLVVKGLNKGPAEVFSILDSELENAMLTMGAHMAIGFYLPGTGLANYERNWDGLTEIVNDGATAGWDGNTYATYGTLSRLAGAGLKVRSTPKNVGGDIEYNVLEETYSDASFGNEEPTIGATTPKCYSYIKTKFQTQQRFNDTQDPSIGFNGLKFNQATIMKSRYVPGTEISGTNFSEAVTYLTETTGGAVVAYPTVTSETFWWLNPSEKYMRLYISDEKEFAFGFTGFKPAQDNMSLVGQMIVLGALTCRGVRYQKQLFGITG